MSIFEALRGQVASFLGQKMKMYALIYHKLALTQLWPKVVSWRFEKTTDELYVKISLFCKLYFQLGHIEISLGDFHAQC